MLMKKMVLDVNMLNALVKGGIFRNVDSSIIVAEDRSGAGQCKPYTRKQCP